MVMYQTNLDFSWVPGWAAFKPWAFDPVAVRWMRSRPEGIQNLFLEFPPGCLVRPLRALKVPAPGTVGIVHSWLEPTPQQPHGALFVRQTPDDSVGGGCEPTWLEVVGYHNGLTPEVMSYFLNASEETLFHAGPATDGT